MQAVRQHAIHDVRVEDIELPTPEAGELLVHIRSVTICASDLHIYSEGNVGGASWDRPFVPGHEAAGLVADSNGTGVPEGTPVVLDPAVACFSCDMCAAGNFHLCRHLKFLDLPPVHGAMCEYLAWPANRVFPAPENLDIAAVPLVEPLSVAVHALEQSARPQGATALVVGCGAVGLCVLQMAKVKGVARVIAADLLPERLAVARELGADLTVDVSRGGKAAELLDLTDGRGVDLAFEVAGPQDALDLCLGAVRPSGEVLIVGIPSEDEYRLSSRSLRQRELTLKMVRRQNENYPEAIRLVEQGKVELTRLLTHRFPIARAKEAFDLAERKADGAIRVAVMP